MTIEIRLISARIWTGLTGRVVDGPVRVEVTKYPAPRLFVGKALPTPHVAPPPPPRHLAVATA